MCPCWNSIQSLDRMSSNVGGAEPLSLAVSQNSWNTTQTEISIYPQLQEKNCIKTNLPKNMKYLPEQWYEKLECVTPTIGLLLSDYKYMYRWKIHMTLIDSLVHTLLTSCLPHSLTASLVHSFCLLNNSDWTGLDWLTYRRISNISHTLEENKIIDHSEVVGASPVGAAPTKSLLWT